MQFEFEDVEELALPFDDEELAELLLSECAAVTKAIAIAAAKKTVDRIDISS